MSRNISLKYSLDWITVIIYLFLITFGWLNIYGASYDFDKSNMLDFSQRAGKQFIWILTAFGLAGAILLIDSKIFSVFANFIYVAVIFLLIITIFIAANVKGSRSWLQFGQVSFQPAEIAKTATALALSKFISGYNFKIKNWKDLLIPLGIIFLPFILIVLQKETGGALVFLAFFFVLYREGMNGIVLLLGGFAIALFIVVIRFSDVVIPENNGDMGVVAGMLLILTAQYFYVFFYRKDYKNAMYLMAGTVIAALIAYLLNLLVAVNYNYIAIAAVLGSCVYWAYLALSSKFRQYWYIALVSIVAVVFSLSADYLFDNMLETHQQTRIKVLLNMEQDIRGVGYNVNQSKIAIGSGGLWGKGFLNGTQTKLKYVPEQDTDFIFCTVGEEWGFWGSAGLLLIYMWLLLRILKIAERQRSKFNQVYGYCVASILFFHLMINVGMVIGIMPVIGIPLPFLSYGGSSLWSFTILLFILLRLDTSRVERI